MSENSSLPIEELYATTILTFTFGVHTCAFGAFLYWVRHQPKVPKFMLVTGLLGLLCTAIVTFVSNLTLSLPQNRDEMNDVAQNVLHFVALANADVVQIWRCAILWRHRSQVMLPSYVLLTISLLFGLSEMIYNAYILLVFGYPATIMTGLSRFPVRSALESVWLFSSCLSTAVSTYLMLIRIGDSDRTRLGAVRHSRFYAFLSHVLRDGGFFFVVVQAIWFAMGVCEIAILGSADFIEAKADAFVAHILEPLLLSLVAMYPIYVTLLAAFGRHILVKDGVIPVTIVLPSTHFDARESVLLESKAEYPWREGFGSRPVQDVRASKVVTDNVFTAPLESSTKVGEKRADESSGHNGKASAVHSGTFTVILRPRSASGSSSSESGSIV